MMNNKDFAVFILTHGRPDHVKTFNTIRKEGYTGRIYIVIDNEDKTAPEYYTKYKKRVIMFDKEAIAKTFDEFDNFSDRRAIVYARNACFEIARNLGITYFLELDDDYSCFSYRINDNLQHPTHAFQVKSLDQIFDAFLEYYKSIPAKSIAMSQGGDWFGGATNFNNPPKRKCMNTFFCSIERPFIFSGRINEDVNTYTHFQSRGNLFLQIPFVQMNQIQTQNNKGGMSDIYLSAGTYIKSFYTIICAPNCTVINMMGTVGKRLHHNICWDNAVPCIIRESHKKS